MLSSWHRALRYTLLFVFLLSSFSALGQAPVRSPKATQPADPDQEARDNPAARQAWFLRGRIVPGKNAAALLHRAFQQKLALRRAQQQAAAAQQAGTSSSSSPATSGGVGILSLPAWTNLGPAPITSCIGTPGACTSFQNQGFSGNPQGNFSGRVQAVVVDPNDATGNTVYVGSAYGGVWKSTNAATANHADVTWTSLFDTNPAAATLSVGAVTVLPGAGPIVLVGTGEPDNAIDSYYGQGILRSTNGGSTWSLISSANSGANTFKGMGFSKFASNGSVVVAATAATSVPSGSNGNGLTGFTKGLYFSNDSGATWSLASIFDPGNVQICIAARGAPQGCSVTDVVFDGGHNTFYAAVRFHGFYFSTDGGQTWNRTPDAGTATIASCPSTTSSACKMFRGQLAVQPATGDLYLVYVSGDNSSTDTVATIFRANFTGNQVASWTSISNAGIQTCGDGPGGNSISDGCGASQGFYDLYIAAAPNGSGTDLYFGAVNLFKCKLANSSQTCNAASTLGAGNAWLNITHVYNQNCGTSYQTMHPDNHALGFVVVGGNIVTYFGNDGGVYRSLDSRNLTGASSGSPVCSGSGNALDDLNTSTLGSLSQFIAISTDPADASITLGGTQDNGSPATAGGQTQPVLTPPLWFEANGGDGGFNFIDHTGNNWYTTNTDVTIQLCNQGVACIETALFNAGTIGTAQVGGDHGAFYTPYMLDPAIDSNVIVVTCRLWRGPVNGTMTVLSNNFDTGTAAQCSGNENNIGASVAAGGPVDGNGLSKVIYAGTAAGNIFDSINASGGVGTFSSQTLSAAGFPVAGVAVDSSVATGLTAYATVQGFTGGPNGHVFQTINGGGTWTDITGNLPDAPANSVLVDPGNHNVIYVGTDVGAFMTSNVNGASTQWSEWGTGMPNVAVLSLATGPDHTLRAGTHGRGVFQILLFSALNGYSLTISNSPLTVYLAALPAVFNGRATARGTFSSQVDLTCISGSTSPPATCTPSPTPITPTGGAGATLTVNASDVVADYNFKLHGVGRDASATLADAAIALHIIDFTLGAPAPGTITVPHNSSNTATFTLTAAGTFGDTVSLSCSGQPAGVTCGFVPNNFAPSNGGTTVTLTVSATEAVAVNTYPINIEASGNLPGA
ncbi:MAG TPA: sialidase family protein, partial [Terriglobales bacterium]|nr:sialidase family protein [Terriglobales bacterium]